MVFICIVIVPVEGIGTNPTSSSVDLGVNPSTDAERTEFVNNLRMKGLSDEEITEKIIEQIKSQRVEKARDRQKIEDDSLTENQKVEIIAQSLDRMAVSDSIKKASQGLWVYLVADGTFKEQLLSEIDEYENKTVSKELLKNNLLEIWKKYEVTHTKDGNVIHIDFKQKDPDVMITKEDIGTLQLVNDIHLEVFIMDQTLNQKWTVDPCHEDVIYYTIIQSLKHLHPMYDYADNARDHSGDPDQGLPWPQRFYNHYYNPNLGIGGAPQSALTDFNYAKAWFIQDNYDMASEYIGKSSHYMADVGNPMHTSEILNKDIHDRYEIYVATQWEAPYFNFKSSVQGNSIDYLLDDPYFAIIHVAEYSNNYVDTLYYKLMSLSDHFLYQDEWTKVITQACLVRTSRYMNGLVDLLLLTQITDQVNLPTDPDDDRFYEDLNGNGNIDFADLILLYNNMDWIALNEPYRLFDYDCSSEIDMDDVILLFNEI